MSKKFRAEEVRKHRSPEDAWLCLHGKVYDVTKFLSEHPGGEDILLELSGSDATKCFDDIGHTQEAIKLKDGYEIGELEGTFETDSEVAATEEKPKTQATTDDDNWTYEPPKEEGSGSMIVFIGLAAAVYAVLFYYMMY